ncbi:CC/Se motif family (seleno)protein [Salicola sp. Rm-C-2C1-2]|uniref:CC/Se motif family (seleno)protein n=1 Tax=Salicola sp. Rm-C-2C1-2 TaxID=3141321 RepID=UPI0032E44A06
MAEVPITIADEARAWLLAGEAALIVRNATRNGCCGGSAGVPVAEPGIPCDIDDYRVIEVDGIAVHLDPGITISKPLTVRLESFLGLRHLFVEGAELASGRD